MNQWVSYMYVMGYYLGYVFGDNSRIAPPMPITSNQQGMKFHHLYSISSSSVMSSSDIIKKLPFIQFIICAKHTAR